MPDDDPRYLATLAALTSRITMFATSPCRKISSAAASGSVASQAVADIIGRPLTPDDVGPQLFNWTGQPAVSLPLAVDDDGLPVGVQLAARRLREDHLLDVAAELETARPWAGRVPAVHAATALRSATWAPVH